MAEPASTQQVPSNDKDQQISPDAVNRVGEALKILGVKSERFSADGWERFVSEVVNYMVNLHTESIRSKKDTPVSVDIVVRAHEQVQARGVPRKLIPKMAGFAGGAVAGVGFGGFIIPVVSNIPFLGSPILWLLVVLVGLAGGVFQFSRE